MKVMINPDKDIVTEIRSKLKENKEKYGKQYCPCVLPNNHNEDTVCMCKEFRDQMERGEEGECHCGLYIAINEQR